MGEHHPKLHPTPQQAEPEPAPKPARRRRPKPEPPETFEPAADDGAQAEADAEPGDGHEPAGAEPDE